MKLLDFIFQSINEKNLEMLYILWCQVNIENHNKNIIIIIYILTKKNIQTFYTHI